MHKRGTQHTCAARHTLVHRGTRHPPRPAGWTPRTPNSLRTTHRRTAGQDTRHGPRAGRHVHPTYYARHTGAQRDKTPATTCAVSHPKCRPRGPRAGRHVHPTHYARHTRAQRHRHPPTTCVRHHTPKAEPNTPPHPTQSGTNTRHDMRRHTTTHGARGLDATYTPLTTHDIYWRTSTQYAHHDMRCVTPHMPNRGPRGLGATYTPPTVHDHRHPR